MKTLLLMRHAKSSWANTSLDDFDRPLTVRGSRAAHRMGEWLRAEDLNPDGVLCSPAHRCASTWHIVATALDGQHSVQMPEALYLADQGMLMDHIQSTSNGCQHLLVISHNPGTQDLALRLTVDGEREQRMLMAEKFPTAAIAVLDCAVDTWRDVKTARLRRYVRPKQLPD